MQLWRASGDDKVIVALTCLPILFHKGRGASLIMARCDLASRSDRRSSRCEPGGTVAGASQWRLSYPKH